MIRIQYKGYRRNVYAAVDKVNNLLSESSFYQRISMHPYFDRADILPSHIADLMQLSDINMNIDFYYSISPTSKAYGYDNTLDPTLICLNAWQIDRSIAGISNTIVHACVHAVNSLFPQYSFGHGTAGNNENTAPYWIGCLSQQLISKNEECEYMVHELPENIINVSAGGKRTGKYYSLISL